MLCQHAFCDTIDKIPDDKKEKTQRMAKIVNENVDQLGHKSSEKGHGS